MKKNKLTMRETIVVASTLFGMFFGAGNLIFPVHLGQMAGSNSWPAIIGFCITAVTIPILAVAAIGNTHSDDLLHLSSKVSGWYGVVFTAALYLTIGPFFAIPRCASVSFTTGVAPIVGESHFRLWQFIFSFVFFAFVMYFSLRPGKITTWIGRIINPLFLAFLAILVIVSLIKPGAPMSSVEPVEAYKSGARVRHRHHKRCKRPRRRQGRGRSERDSEVRRVHRTSDGAHIRADHNHGSPV